MEDVDELREVLAVVSEKVPALIRGLMTSVFSPEAAADMGKAAATYYKELKAGGIPDAVAVQMTQDYIHTFTKISEFIRTASRGSGEHADIEDEVEKRVRQKLALKLGEGKQPPE